MPPQQARRNGRAERDTSGAAGPAAEDRRAQGEGRKAQDHARGLGSEHERGKTHAELWTAAIQPLRDRLAEEGPRCWNWIVDNYDDLSTRESLEQSRWSEGAIEMFGLFANLEALMNASFLELFREEAGHFYEDMVQIAGGMDLLPRAFMPALAGRIRFGARVTALEQDANGVSVHYRAAARRHAETGEYAIVAPEGRFHFAGEHASLAHAWIQGSIKSGLRAAKEVAQRTA